MVRNKWIISAGAGEERLDFVDVSSSERAFVIEGWFLLDQSQVFILNEVGGTM
jgi:hypothetical protein